jgi:hypothetical protein
MSPVQIRAEAATCPGVRRRRPPVCPSLSGQPTASVAPCPDPNATRSRRLSRRRLSAACQQTARNRRTAGGGWVLPRRPADDGAWPGDCAQFCLYCARQPDQDSTTNLPLGRRSPRAGAGRVLRRDRVDRVCSRARPPRPSCRYGRRRMASIFATLRSMVGRARALTRLSTHEPQERGAGHDDATSDLDARKLAATQGLGSQRA